MNGRHKNRRKPSKQANRTGRPSNSQRQVILVEQGTELAQLLKREPLRQPTDPHFPPYYEQVLQGFFTPSLQFGSGLLSK